MAIEGFDYQNFAQGLASQADELLPTHFNDFEKQYVIKTIQNFANLAGEALYNDNTVKFNAEQAMLITQIIAEWSFHKSVDLIKSGIMEDYWDVVMQKIAFTIFEISKKSIAQGSPQDQTLQLVEHHVHKAYEEALLELKNNGIIDAKIFEKATHQSNIDVMMDQIQHDKDAAANLATNGEAPSQNSDSKILKLASVALLLKQVNQDKVQTILNKFNSQDAQAVIQYMQMTDLEQKVDKNIAMKCLQEIKTTLPEPKQISPTKILSKLKNIFESNDRTKIETSLIKERPMVKNFIKSAYEGEYLEMPSKVANIIAQHIEDNV